VPRLRLRCEDPVVRVFSYVVVADSGFAPNPFHGVCTLACCKPSIRKHAQVGDLVVGLSTRCERVVYAMKVQTVLGFDDYWRDARGLAKRPDRASSAARYRRGDWRQHLRATPRRGLPSAAFAALCPSRAA
jgi:hypothetical protein